MNSTDLIEKIKIQIEVGLPGEAAHLAMAPFNRPLSSLALKQSSDHRISSVAVVLYENNSKEVSLILIKRTHYEGAHSGQISFPGGKKDPTDSDTEFTARRECFEEIGLCLEQKDCLGKLTDVYIPVSKFLVHPFIYFCSDPADLKPDEREVSEVFTIDLEQLTDTRSISIMDIRFPNGLVQKEIPCFIFGAKKVWGATALILNELREILNRI
jgi:8-oxo-dGTP pyrophosphatase MutT (NUDIX family)